MNRNAILTLGIALMSVLPGPVRADDEFQKLDATLSDRAVVMELPEGVRRVRLRVRQVDGTWKLCTVAHLEGTERYLKLRLPDGVAAGDIEVAASHADPFPYSHYQGQTAFAATASEGNAVAGPMSPNSFEDSKERTTADAVVEESDIWKWRGSTVYFFNQYRGLQVIDVSDPAAPEHLASHRLPASGEQMYLHPGTDLVVLLTYDPNSGNGEVVLVRHESKYALREQERIPVPGYILESRMVGEILYVVSRRSFEERSVDAATGVEHVTWRSGLSVTRIDLRDPDQPVVDPALSLASDRFNFWGAQVQATPQALLVATNTWDSTRQQSITTVHVVDISDPSAPPAVTHQIPVAGEVLNKYNMQLKDGILTVVSQVWRGSETRQRYASVETFDLTGGSGAGSARLGRLEFAPNESITATRFVGDLVYVVTFLRIDPLFVVSLADPARPRLLSELEVPGFSTHLEPFGEDALISVGVEGSQVAVSWFDVSDPGNATLASRVFVGAPDGWSWTEANWDEKAFGFFPDERLILLPYQGPDPEGGWFTGVQVIELGDGELIKRGSFAHEFQARRAKVLDTAIASISGRSLRTLDLSDPDNPRLLANLPLAWPADLVHRVGDSLVQLERGGAYWYRSLSSGNLAGLYVSPVNDPDTLTASLDLGPGRVAGSLLVNDCLWVAQVLTETVEEGGTYRNAESFVITAVDLSDPAQAVIVGRDTLTTKADNYWTSYGSDYAGALLPDGSLVWYPAGRNNYFYYGFRGGPFMIDFLMPFVPASGRVYTVDIADQASPKVLAAVEVRESDRHWPEGAWRLLGSVLYYGFQNTEELILPDGSLEWRAHHWLGQLDLAEPAKPVKRELVKLPGTFEHALGTPAGGSVLFTSVARSWNDGDVWRNEFRIQALAFDGLMAFLLDELVVPEKGYGPTLFDGGSIVLGKNDYSTRQAHTDLTVYEWLSSGAFLKGQTWRRSGSVSQLAVADHVLIASGSDGLAFIDFVDPGDPVPAEITFPSASYWQRLELIDIYRREAAHLPQGMQGVATLDFGGAFAPVPAVAAGTDDSDADPEWVLIDLARLPVAAAGDALLIGALPAGESWMATTFVGQVPYEDWIRTAFGLAPGAPVPAGWVDADSDGLTNEWEYRTGSNPGDPASAAAVETFVSLDPDGDRCFQARVFSNPHATGALRVETSRNARDWSFDPEDIEIVADPFSPSVIVRFRTSVDKQARGFMRFSFAEE